MKENLHYTYFDYTEEVPTETPGTIIDIVREEPFLMDPETWPRRIGSKHTKRVSLLDDIYDAFERIGDRLESIFVNTAYDLSCVFNNLCRRVKK